MIQRAMPCFGVKELRVETTVGLDGVSKMRFGVGLGKPVALCEVSHVPNADDALASDLRTTWGRKPSLDAVPVKQFYRYLTQLTPFR